MSRCVFFFFFFIDDFHLEGLTNLHSINFTELSPLSSPGLRVVVLLIPYLSTRERLINTYQFKLLEIVWCRVRVNVKNPSWLVGDEDEEARRLSSLYTAEHNWRTGLVRVCTSLKLKSQKTVGSFSYFHFPAPSDVNKTLCFVVIQ